MKFFTHFPPLAISLSLHLDIFTFYGIGNWQEKNSKIAKDGKLPNKLMPCYVHMLCFFNIFLHNIFPWNKFLSHEHEILIRHTWKFMLLLHWKDSPPRWASFLQGISLSDKEIINKKSWVGVSRGSFNSKICYINKRS